MRITDHIVLIGSGRMGFDLSHELDCHVWLIHHGDDAVIVDSGAGVDIAPILARLDATGVPRSALRRMLLTHAHPDHAGGAAALHGALGVPVAASAEVAAWISSGDAEGAGFTRLTGPGGYSEGYTLTPCPVEYALHDGERIPVGGLEIEIVATPGHSAGHLSYALHRPGGIDLFAGDAIFARGRILLQNLPDCSVAESCDSVRRLARLAPDGFYPGHAEFAVQRGAYHIYSAWEAIEASMPPPQLT